MVRLTDRCYMTEILLLRLITQTQINVYCYQYCDQYKSRFDSLNSIVISIKIVSTA